MEEVIEETKRHLRKLSNSGAMDYYNIEFQHGNNIETILRDINVIGDIKFTKVLNTMLVETNEPK